MLNVGATPIRLFCGPVDMRKSFNGLSALVIRQFEEPLTGGSFFLFVNKRRTMLKVLYWDQDGLALWSKRLESGTFRVRWDGSSTLSRRDFSLLLEGVTPRRLNKRYKVGK